MNRTLDFSSSLRRPLVVAAALVVAVAAGAEELTRRGGGASTAEVHDERSLPTPLRAVGRHDRVPSEPGGYVDVWGPLAPWEVRVLQGQGTSRTGR